MVVTPLRCTTKTEYSTPDSGFSVTLLLALVFVLAALDRQCDSRFFAVTGAGTLLPIFLLPQLFSIPIEDASLLPQTAVSVHIELHFPLTVSNSTRFPYVKIIAAVKPG